MKTSVLVVGLIILAVIAFFVILSIKPMPNYPLAVSGAKTVIRDCFPHDGRLSTSRNVFVSLKDTISSKEIAAVTAEFDGVIDESHLCITIGDFENNPEWKVEDGKRIIHNGANEEIIFWQGTCDTCAGLLNTIFQASNISINPELLDVCDSTIFNSNNAQETCCVLVPKKAN